jgi:hypothetical protein
VGFLTGFVVVLCIGNYYRARRAMERQKQRRIARLSGHAGNGVIGVDSPCSNQSTASSHMSEEQQHLLGSRAQNAAMKQQTARRRNMEESTGTTLLLDITDTGPRAQISAV